MQFRVRGTGPAHRASTHLTRTEHPLREFVWHSKDPAEHPGHAAEPEDDHGWPFGGGARAGQEILQPLFAGSRCTLPLQCPLCLAHWPLQRLLAGIRQRAEFTFEEYKTILNFQYGIDQSLSETAAAQSDREYNMHLIDLHALAIDMEDDAE